MTRDPLIVEAHINKSGNITNFTQFSHDCESYKKNGFCICDREDFEPAPWLVSMVDAVASSNESLSCEIHDDRVYICTKVDVFAFLMPRDENSIVDAPFQMAMDEYLFMKTRSLFQFIDDGHYWMDAEHLAKLLRMKKTQLIELHVANNSLITSFQRTIESPDKQVVVSYNHIGALLLACLAQSEGAPRVRRDLALFVHQLHQMK